MKKLHTFKHKRRAFRACDALCASGFKTDRAMGAVYGPFVRADGTFLPDAETASIVWNQCAYCALRGAS